MFISLFYIIRDLQKEKLPLPQYDCIRMKRRLYINNTLVTAATKKQTVLVFLFNKTAVDQNINIGQNSLKLRRSSNFFKAKSRIAPDIFSAFRFYSPSQLSKSFRLAKRISS